MMQIHWFSIFNSFMMVIFLTGLVSMILMRTLRNDYAKYAREDDDLETLVMLSNNNVSDSRSCTHPKKMPSFFSIEKFSDRLMTIMTCRKEM